MRSSKPRASTRARWRRAQARPDLADGELAPVQEALGDAWYRPAEYRKALDAYTTAQAQVAGEQLLEARTCCSSSRASRRSSASTPRRCAGSTARARRSTAQQGLEAARQSAKAERVVRDGAAGAGPTGPRRVEWAERAAREAEEVDDPEALGDAYLVLGWAHAALGKEGAEALMLKSLEAYQRSGNRVRQASILSNLGGACYWEGRWDDAMSYYERGRDESMKVGNLVNAAAAAMNIAEILTDRGELAEAEAMLQQTLPVWKSSEYRYFLGACLWMLGRVSLRANRIDEALARFAEARRLSDRGRRRARGAWTSTRGSPSAVCSRTTPTPRSRSPTRSSRAGRLGSASRGSRRTSTACAATRC